MPTVDYRRFWRWFARDFLGIAREMRWSYLPPLMIYLAAGVSGFTGIVESFFVKQELGLSAAFLASLAFWAGCPTVAPSGLPGRPFFNVLKHVRNPADRSVERLLVPHSAR